MEHDEKPSALAKIQSATTSVMEWAILDRKFVSSDEYTRRFSHCEKCDQFDANAFVGTGKCNACGCALRAKLLLPRSACPKRKW